MTKLTTVIDTSIAPMGGQAVSEADRPSFLVTPRDRQAMVVGVVLAERKRQDGKWGGWPGVDRIDERYTAVLGEEFGEVCKAQLENGELSDELYEELSQVAAVAMAWMEQIDALRPFHAVLKGEQ